MRQLKPVTQKAAWSGASLRRITLPEPVLREILRRHGREAEAGRFLDNMALSD